MPLHGQSSCLHFGNSWFDSRLVSRWQAPPQARKETVDGMILNLLLEAFISLACEFIASDD